MPATIKDVARIAGVSETSVSHALNGTRRVSVALRERVLAASAALEYHPDVAARSLRTGRTHALGLLIPDITNSWYPAVARGVQDATAAAGYHTFLCNTDGRADHEIAFASELARRRVGGVVAVTFGADHDALRRTLRGIPTVVFCYPPEADEERDVVWFDNVGAARLAVDYLIASGRRRIATVCGTRGYQGAQDRLQGYREALRARGLDVDPALIVDGDYMLRSGAEAATRLLRVNPRPDAIFAANDLMALGALGALREAGIAVPDDIALIGLDDIPEAEIAYPQLTTVRQPAYEMGLRAGQLLMRRLQAAESGGAAAPRGEVVRIKPVLVRRATA